MNHSLAIKFLHESIDSENCVQRKGKQIDIIRNVEGIQVASLYPHLFDFVHSKECYAQNRQHKSSCIHDRLPLSSSFFSWSSFLHLIDVGLVRLFDALEVNLGREKVEHWQGVYAVR